jgi:hypothetical protein
VKPKIKILLVMKNLLRTVLVIPAMVLAIVSTAQVPIMNSLPSAPANTPTILLDFDGHTVSGTSWNFGGPIVCGAAGLDNTQITEVFNRVAEDYRPFMVNITTDETKYAAAPINKRSRVILTISNSWYGNGAGGVAFVNSFTWGDNTPCFVFTALFNYNVKNISEATAHEAGHTLGLYHQAKYDENCVYLSDYNNGAGTGEIGWAPIMGVGYARNFTIWHNGPNAGGCNQTQNDLDVITSAANGIVYRADDHSSTFNQATHANFSNNQFNVQGIIERNTDQDMIRFSLQNGGRFVLNAVPYNVGTGNVGSDLDLQVSLYNNAQTLINIYNPGALLSSVIDTVLSSGIYYLRVEGKGNAFAPAYASLGSYSLQGNFTGGALPLRRLELNGAVRGNKHQLNWLIDADEQVTDLALEISTDGRNFESLTQSDVQARAFAYTPFTANNSQYRLNVTFDNGRQYYSNIVSLRGFDNRSKPQLAGTILYTNTITVSSPGAYQYTVHDITGKIVSRGNLNSGVNKITSASLVNGMYIIRFTKDDEQWIEKFIRQ